jgi:hypothetical protein
MLLAGEDNMERRLDGAPDVLGTAISGWLKLPLRAAND